MHSKSNQHGSVTVLAMVSLLIMTSLAGVYFNKNISGLSKTFSFNYGQQNYDQAVAGGGFLGRAGSLEQRLNGHPVGIFAPAHTLDWSCQDRPVHQEIPLRHAG